VQQAAGYKMKYSRRCAWSGPKVALPNDLDIILMPVEELYLLTLAIASSNVWHNKLQRILRVRPAAGQQMLAYAMTNKLASTNLAWSRWASVYQR
jgi:hypothetical protein